MKLKGLLTCVFWITSSFLYGQSDSKEITYNKNGYNIYKIKITPIALESFAIFYNNDGLSQGDELWICHTNNHVWNSVKNTSRMRLT